MACIEYFTERTCRRHVLVLTWLVIGSSFLAFPAWGGVGLGATATYPPSVEVGQTNLAVSLNISNASSPSQSITLSSIKHTPSCGMSAVPCPAGSEDPGVFLVKGPATGTTGSACAGISFTIGSPDPTTGEVTFTPSGTVILPTAGSSCTIDFFVDALRVPAKNASAGPTIQTFSGARATGSAGATGTGGTPITVEARTPHIPAPAVSSTVLGIIATLLTGCGVVCSRRRTFRLARESRT